jgi:hypothetical protein
VGEGGGGLGWVLGLEAISYIGVPDFLLFRPLKTPEKQFSLYIDYQQLKFLFTRRCE